MTKPKTKKTIFVIISKSKAISSQENIVRYAVALATRMDCNVVLYPENGSEARILETKSLIRNLNVADTLSLCVSESTSTIFNFWKSIPKIAKEENAFMVMIGAEKGTEYSIWDTIQRSKLPVITIPEIEFTPYSVITMAMDMSIKIQKTSLATKLAKIFSSEIHIFQENNIQEGFKMTPTLTHIERLLEEYKIPFTLIKARKTTKFSTRLCKYSSKHANLLIIEVDLGKINKDTKENIEMLLHHDQPVLFVKTKETQIMTGNFR